MSKPSAFRKPTGGRLPQHSYERAEERSIDRQNADRHDLIARMRRRIESKAK
ncbi:hypothetical protein ACL02R_30000 [Streptomyces sp. MS19]|uniref:hypothetical protein n=1 Tax=Streptomyces sp. MS19 TaxID=3385972 RepID=UPI0039A15E9C